MTRIKTTQAAGTKRERTIKNGVAARTGAGKVKDSSRPATPLGRRLHEIRARVVAEGLAEGTPPLDWNSVAREVAARRGESS